MYFPKGNKLIYFNTDDSIPFMKCGIPSFLNFIPVYLTKNVIELEESKYGTKISINPSNLSSEQYKRIEMEYLIHKLTDSS